MHVNTTIKFTMQAIASLSLPHKHFIVEIRLIRLGTLNITVLNTETVKKTKKKRDDRTYEKKSRSQSKSA